jgi:hypothetical protein
MLDFALDARFPSKDIFGFVFEIMLDAKLTPRQNSQVCIEADFANTESTLWLSR